MAILINKLQIFRLSTFKLDPIFTKNQDWIEKFKDQDGYTTVACACTSTEHNDSVKDNGFVYGHAYTVVGVDLEKRLIRVRNPWGTYESTKYDDGVNDGEFWVDEETFIGSVYIGWSRITS